MSATAKINQVLSQVKNINEVIDVAKKLLANTHVSKIESDVIPVHCNLAASYGTLTKESVKKMDQELKVIIAGTVRSLKRINDYSWRTVLGTMMQNSLLKPKEGSAITRADKLIKKGTSCFKTDGSADQSIVNEVNSWFIKLISDSDVLKDTKIDINMMGRIVGASGAKITSFATFFYKKQYYEKTIVDIGIIRYPDIENPYFKLYRIQLTAWSDCSRILFYQEDKNGISGQYNCIKFVPRESVLIRLRAATIDKAVDEAEDLFA